MTKMYITKEDLINQLDIARDKLFRDNTVSPGPFAYIAVIILVTGTILLSIPIILFWLLVILLYIPGYVFDSIFVNYFYKGKK